MKFSRFGSQQMSLMSEAYIDHFRGAFTILSGYRTFDQILREGFAVYDILC